MAVTRPRISPSAETLRYFAEKKLVPSFSYKDVWGEEHAHAFTVAKSSGFDVLDDIREAVKAALENGETFETFKEGLEPLLRAKGWWGKKRLIDPKTGETVIAQLGSPRRLKTIYQANLRAARAAGQWERAQKVKKTRPYFLYSLGPSEVHRPHHQSKEGLILLVDDPFWDAWYPPNGWGCKCWLRQITEREAQSLGGAGTAPDSPTREFYNSRKNSTEQIPVGIDPGWQTNPGKARARGLTNRFNERLEQEGEGAVRQVIGEVWSNGTAAALSEVAERVRIPVAVASKLKAETGAQSALVTVSSDTLMAKSGKHGHHKVSPVSLETFARVQEFIDKGEYTGRDQKGGYRFWLTVENRMHRLILGLSRQGFLYVKTLFQTSPAKLEKEKR